MMQPETSPAWQVRGLDRLPVLPGETLAGRYRIERVLGAGGMGIVLCARELDANRRVAVKLLNPTSTDVVDAARFRLECDILASLDGASVARIYERGEVDGLPYVVMEYFEGPTLAELLHAEGPLDVEFAVACLRGICAALSEVHGKRIVHRDVKLENVVLVGAGKQRTTKLIDFGIARSLDAPPLEASDGWIGSPRYMAPEQLDGTGADARADIWSVGIVAFELLTGEHPFVADTVEQLQRAIVEDEAPSIRVHRPELPEALAEIVARCLATARERRFASVEELSAALSNELRPFAS